MAIDHLHNLEAKLITTRWHSLKLYNAYRVLIALMLLLSHNSLIYNTWWQSLNTDFFSMLAMGYLAFSLIAVIFTWSEKPNLEVTLPIQIIFDVAFILLLMHAENSSQSGIGLLLIIAIASAGLISHGRLALFYAAIATIGILLEQSYSYLYVPNTSGNYPAAVILSVACFAIAWLAHSLAKRMHQSELLASQRGIDLQNLAHANALITQKMKDGVLVVDQDLNIKHHNTQAEVFLNVGHEDWQEKRLHEISPEISNLIQGWLNEAGSFMDTITPNILKVNILSRNLRISFLPIAEDRNLGAVIFIEDWSHTQTQAHQVKLAALGRLTANIAHEVRNPLSSISHANQLMQEEEDISPTNKRMLQIISDNVERVDQIIKDVLELNRRDRTNQEIIPLESFITDFYHQFCAVEKIPTNHFKLTMTDAQTIILFDRRHLNQILWNLCKNGWRHSKKIKNSLKLDVFITKKTLTVNIEVTDDGKGIPENVSPHLFEPFFTTEKSGTGLGLYIGRELADANGATLHYKTSSTGTKFIMLIKKASI